MLNQIYQGDTVTDWMSEFAPAVIDDGSERHERWYTVQYVTQREVGVVRLFKVIGLPFRVFTFREFQRKAKPVDRSWHPGYFFTSFDIDRDRWSQIRRIPGIVSILGTPNPSALHSGVMEWLEQRLPIKVEKKSLVGKDVRVVDGPFTSWSGKVTRESVKDLDLFLIVFGRPTRVTLKHNQIEAV